MKTYSVLVFRKHCWPGCKICTCYTNVKMCNELSKHTLVKSDMYVYTEICKSSLPLL